MLRRLIVGTTLLIGVGCTDQSPVPSNVDEDQASAAKASWSLERSASGIDGSVIGASKLIELGQDVTVYSEVSCKEEKRIPSLSIQSTVGDAANPDERSAFSAKLALTGFVHEMVPVGRLKMGDEEASSLGLKFRIDESYANKMVMNGLFVRDMRFPMVIEFSNGAGQFELRLDSDDVVAQVLQACGISASDQQANPAAAVVEDPRPIDSVPMAQAQTHLNPSFSCALASTRVESLICGSRELSRLDAAMAENYKRMLASDLGGAKDSLRSTQREWVKARNACQEEACLKSAYSERLDAICEYPVASGIHPECHIAEDVL